MIICNKHKFIFVKTRKTAGSSVEIFLSKYCGPSCVITPLSKEDEILRKKIGGRPPQNFFKKFKDYTLHEILLFVKNRKKIRKYNEHDGVKKILQNIEKKIFDNYFVFTIERNSYTKTISNYHWKNSKPHNNFLNFQDYLVNGNHTHRDWNSYSIKNHVIVDYIIKYENLYIELEHVCNKIGIPFNKENLPFAKKGRNSFSTESYTNKQIKIVQSLFKNEIKYFNFKFPKK